MDDAAIPLSIGSCEARQPRSNPPAPVRLNQWTLRGASGDVAISQLPATLHSGIAAPLRGSQCP